MRYHAFLQNQQSVEAPMPTKWIRSGWMEIQEAASVITESIDPEAKVIFGAIRDEKLKKGEVKVTVIASGFGGENSRARAARSTVTTPITTRESAREARESTAEQPVKSRTVINATNDFGVGVVMENKKSSAGKEKEVEPEVEEDWALPAFLRRQKNK